MRSIVGIELDPAYAEDARRRLDDVHCLDLNDLPRRGHVLMALGRFDCIRRSGERGTYPPSSELRYQEVPELRAQHDSRIRPHEVCQTHRHLAPRQPPSALDKKPELSKRAEPFRGRGSSRAWSRNHASLEDDLRIHRIELALGRHSVLGPDFPSDRMHVCGIRRAASLCTRSPSRARSASTVGGHRRAPLPLAIHLPRGSPSFDMRPTGNEPPGVTAMYSRARSRRSIFTGVRDTSGVTP